MADALFSITCTTCQAKLAVRDAALIGQITTCPRCESMVEVVPPPGWTPPQTGCEVHGGLVPPALPLPSAGAGAEEQPAPESAKTPPPAGFAPAASEDRGSPEVTASPPAVASAVQPPPIGSSPAETTAGPPPLPTEPSLGGRAGRPWLIWGAGSAAVVVVAVAIWASVGGKDRAAPAPPAASAHAGGVVGKTPSVAVVPQPAAQELSHWLPASARLFVELDAAGFRNEPDLAEALVVAEPTWQVSVEPVAKAFGIKRASIERVEWASSDLAHWADWSVVVLRLADHQDATALDGMGTPVDLEVEGHRCYQLPDGGVWPHPYAIIDKQTILTGRRELLAELAQSGRSSRPEALGRLLEHSPGDAAFRVLIDLRAAREAGWPLPSQWMDVWPKGRAWWHLLWDTSQGMGLSLKASAKPQSVCLLACATPSAAEKVLAAIEELIPEARTQLAARSAGSGELASAGLAPEAIAQYSELLGYAGAALEASHVRQIEDVVVVETAWPGSPSRVAVAARRGSVGARADWLAAALAGCRQRQEQVGAGLAEYQKTEQKLPAGGGGLLPPETRLSWIAALLPNLGRRDWYERLQFAYNWNGNENRPVTSQVLEEVVNPALGLSRTEAGFPVTHVVGLAGVGSDAASLPVTDPRAGVFGYGRTTRMEDIRDGTSNTIAVLGVTDRLGAWGAGGPATIRPLTKPPYVNGPDGFGSGQPNGMLACMADGSVRFVAQEVDPHVLEQLATINGGEGATVAALETQPAPPASAAPSPAAETPAASPPDAASPAPQATAAAPKAPEQPATEPGAEPVAEAEETDDAPAPGRPALEPVDVAARLGVPVPAIHEPAITLRDLGRLVADFGGLPVTFDASALEFRGASLTDRVEVRLENATLGQVLEAGVSRRGLVVTPGVHCVLVTCPASARQEMRTVRYDVSDLVGPEPNALAQFGKRVETLVVPDAWESAGGMGSLSADGTALVVRQTEMVHYRVLVFCERLRVARHLPPRSRYPAELFSLTTRADALRPVLDKPVTANFQPGTPLEKILRYLEDQAAVALSVDWERLAEEGIGPATEAAVASDKVPLHDALTELLQPLGLVGCPRDQRTLSITTKRAAAAEWELEFYPVSRLLADGTSEAQLIERLQGELAGDTWADAGGAGVVVFDEPSGALVVLQSPPVQQAISGWLRAAAQPK